MSDNKRILIVGGGRINSILDLLVGVAEHRNRHVIQVPEKINFDPAKKWGPGFAPAKDEYGLYRPDDRNVQFAGNDLDLACVTLVPPLNRRADCSVNGVERREHLHNFTRSYVRLGIKVFLQLLHHPERIPNYWHGSGSQHEVTICFDGDYFMDAERRIFMPTITFSGKDMLDGYKYVDESFAATDFSALWPLAKVSVECC